MEIDDNDVHDFRPHTLKWGWSGLHFKITDKIIGAQKAEMCGVSGVDTLGLGKRIKKGQYILMCHSGQEVVWHIDYIEYENNPKDMFNAKLSYAGVPE